MHDTNNDNVVSKGSITCDPVQPLSFMHNAHVELPMPVLLLVYGGIEVCLSEQSSIDQIPLRPLFFYLRVLIFAIFASGYKIANLSARDNKTY